MRGVTGRRRAGEESLREGELERSHREEERSHREKENRRLVTEQERRRREQERGNHTKPLQIRCEVPSLLPRCPLPTRAGEEMRSNHKVTSDVKCHLYCRDATATEVHVLPETGYTA